MLETPDGPMLEEPLGFSDIDILEGMLDMLDEA